ncbi:hypothetical protein AV530_013688 [Patagioenas fasciata monilis]|uniref:Uncharacterized protein n=1 Tax=Patagioenas fasciata monilis TaxID=372326 RepID=A0A1V4J8R7_PATFA|nr:hypothetical protein AV530_013688 [Patagioenas fasciata monilis]
MHGPGPGGAHTKAPSRLGRPVLAAGLRRIPVHRHGPGGAPARPQIGGLGLPAHARASTDPQDTCDLSYVERTLAER